VAEIHRDTSGANGVVWSKSGLRNIKNGMERGGRNIRELIPRFAEQIPIENAIGLADTPANEGQRYRGQDEVNRDVSHSAKWTDILDFCVGHGEEILKD
jgi:hypothetical protein